MYELVIIFCLAFKEAFVKLCDFMCAKYCRNKWDERNKRWQELNHHGLLLPASLAVHPRGQSPVRVEANPRRPKKALTVTWTPHYLGSEYISPNESTGKILILCVT